MWRSASLSLSSILQDFKTALDAALPDSSLLQKRHRTQTQQQSPSLGIRNSQKEADGEFRDAKAHSRETNACCPMSFNTERCANSAGLPGKRAKPVCNFAAHSILIIGGFPFILPDASWPVGGFETLKARVQASDSQKLAVLVITSFMLLSAPLLSAKEGHHSTTQKGCELKTHWDTGQQFFHVAHPPSMISPLITSTLASEPLPLWTAVCLDLAGRHSEQQLG